MEFYEVFEKSYLQHRGKCFFILLKKHIFVEGNYQLKNFNTKFIGCHLSCLLLASELASYRQIKYLETNLIPILNVGSLPVGVLRDIAYETCESTG